MRRATTLTILALVMVGGTLPAQQRQTRERTGKPAAGESRERIAPDRVSANGIPTGPAAPNVTGSPSSNVGAPGGKGGGIGFANPIDPYTRISSQLRNQPGYRYQPWDLYYCDVFYSRLMMDFGYRSGRDAFWTFAQGYPALTPEAAGLALQRSTEAANRILSLTSALGKLLDSHQAGGMTDAQLEEKSRDLVDEIRRQTRKVREDYYVAYLDQRKDPNLQKFGTARDAEGLRQLIYTLRSRALALKQDFDQFLKEDRTRVVSVEDLAQPSFKARSKEIDRLAVAIKKSVAQF